MDAAARAVQALELRIAADARDATSHYRLGVLLLDEYQRTGEPALPGQARGHLARATGLRPKHARAHAALGYACDLAEDRAGEALACFREAFRLDPQDNVSDAYVPTLLAESGREGEALAWLEAAAPRHGVDLAALRGELAAAGMPVDAGTLLLNGFIRARNFLRASLSDEAERILDALEPGRARKQAAAERERCAGQQQALSQAFDALRVPEPLRSLAGWAGRFGVGDDYCRPFLLGRMPKKDRAALTREVDANAAAIQAWLDSFGDAPMPPEAAAFMYLALGVEEIRG